MYPSHPRRSRSRAPARFNVHFESEMFSNNSDFQSSEWNCVISRAWATGYRRSVAMAFHGSRVHQASHEWWWSPYTLHCVICTDASMYHELAFLRVTTCYPHWTTLGLGKIIFIDIYKGKITMAFYVATRYDMSSFKLVISCSIETYHIIRLSLTYGTRRRQGSSSSIWLVHLGIGRYASNARIASLIMRTPPYFIYCKDRHKENLSIEKRK